MALQLDTVNQEVQRLHRTVVSSGLVEKAKTTGAMFAARVESVLERAGQTKGGIKSLTQGKDVSYDPFGEPVDATDSICEITDAVPGLASDLVGDPSEFEDDLNAIIGAANTSASIARGSLKRIISAGSPLAVAEALSEATGKTANEIQSALQEISTPNATSAISSLEQVRTEGIAVASELASVLEEAVSNFDNVVNNFVGDLFGDLTIEIDKSFTKTITDLVNFDIPNIANQISLNEIYNLISEEDYGKLTSKVARVTSIDANIVDRQLKPLSLNPSKVVKKEVPPSIGTKSIPCYDIGSNENTWKAEETPTITPPPVTRGIKPTPTSSQFSFVSSREELAAEFASATRAITEVVVHWTGTYNNQDIGAEDVHEWHKKRGWSGIGYHFIIRRDGRIQRGRPINKTGAHAGANGHNKYSIGISFAAGYNCPSGTKNANKFISADSITPAQMKSFEMFLGAFYDEWPGGQVFGHVDTDDKGKVDPGFDVQEYARAKFGKTNVITSGQKPPLSPQQLASATPGTARA